MVRHAPADGPTVSSGVHSARAAACAAGCSSSSPPPSASSPSPSAASSDAARNHARHAASSPREAPAAAPSPGRSGPPILRSPSYCGHPHRPAPLYGHQPAYDAHKSLECSFDSNPTALYLHLQARAWDLAAARAHTHLAEAHTWISRHDRPTPHPASRRLRWRLLPLHAAVIFRAPPCVVAALLCSYPLGAAAPDDQGMLPLHLAFRSGSSPRTVQLLLVAYPNSLTVGDRRGRTPAALASMSRSEHREEYAELLARGVEYYAVAGAAWMAGINSGGDTGGGTSGANSDEAVARLRDEYEARIAHLHQTHAAQLAHLRRAAVAEATGARSGASRSSAELERRARQLGADNAALAERGAGMEKELRAAAEREREGGEEVRSLRARVHEMEAERSDGGGRGGLLAQERDAALSANVQLKAQLRAMEEDRDAIRRNLLDQSVQHTRMLAEREAERAEMDSALLALEEEVVSARSEVAQMEGRMVSRDVSERSLVANVTHLTRQLAEVTECSRRVEAVYEQKVDELERTQVVLRSEKDNLAYRLDGIGRTLDSMVAEQDRIVSAAAEHEERMLRGIDVQRRMVDEAAAQAATIERAKREREDMVALLARHAEDIERACDQRQSMVVSVRRQEEEMRAATAGREELIRSVRVQKESLRAVQESEQLGGGVGGSKPSDFSYSRSPYARSLVPAAAPTLPAPVASTSADMDTDYKAELEKLKVQRDAAFAKVDIKALSGQPDICPTHPGDVAELPLPASPSTNSAHEPTPTTTQSQEEPPSAARPLSKGALELAGEVLTQATEALSPEPAEKQINRRPWKTPWSNSCETRANAPAEDFPTRANPPLNSMPSEDGIKTSISKPPLPPLPSAPTGDSMPYKLNGSFSVDQFVVKSLTTEELIEEGQSVLRQMPSLAGRDSPDTTDDVDSQDGSEDNSDFALHHATSLGNDKEEEEEDHIIDGNADDDDTLSLTNKEQDDSEDHIHRLGLQHATSLDNDDYDPEEDRDVLEGVEDVGDEGDEDDESALEREAKELERQLTLIQSHGSETIYGVVTMESNSILATPSYLSDMRNNVGSRD